ncbi:MAG: fimbrillin family protein [Bacteroidaceae bacterium]|nr:fimbrillin family protein [Bacteroidaceae bacterium]
MKKSLFIATVVSMTLASCVQEEVVLPQNGEDKAISFSTPVVGLNTRAAKEVGVNYNTGLNFKVWGQYHAEGDEASAYEWKDDQYIDGVVASYDDGQKTWYPKDASGNLFYWPKEGNGSLTFIACSPANMNATPSIDEDGLTLKDIIIAENPDDQVDILYSERTYFAKKDDYPDPNDVYGGCNLEFKHALSSILFNVKMAAAYSGTTVRLKGIRFENVHMKGTFKQNLEAATEGNEKPVTVPSEITVEEAKEASTGEFTAAPSVILSALEKEDTSDDEYGKIITVDGYYPSTGGADAPTDPTVSEEQKPAGARTRAAGNLAGYRNTDFILLPQLVDKGVKDVPDAGEDIILVIEYSIQHGSGTPIEQVYSTDFTATDATKEWKSGYRYTYNVTISLDPITLAPSVNVWTDADLTPGT